MSDYFRKQQPIHFVSPIDGDCMNELDWEVIDGTIMIKVNVMAPKESEIYINEIKANYDGCYFTAMIPLFGYRNTLYVENKQIPEMWDKIVVYKLEHAVGKYRIGIDDVILAMADLTKNKDQYNSIFDNPFFAIFKEAHYLYGLKVSFNLFYETDDMLDFGEKYEYFNLSMMTDKYKEEWKNNADWLQLAFHARREHPDCPYANTTIENIKRDCELIHKEIKRFASEENLSDVVTLHWGTTNVKGIRTLRTLGYKGALGYFELDEAAEPFVAYYYPSDITEHVGKRDFWMDNHEDMAYARIDVVLNLLNIDNLIEELEKVKAEKARGGFIEMVIHEQYFYEDYLRYIKEYKEIILNTCKWASDNGYVSSFLEDVMFE